MRAPVPEGEKCKPCGVFRHGFCALGKQSSWWKSLPVLGNLHHITATAPQPYDNRVQDPKASKSGRAIVELSIKCSPVPFRRAFAAPG